MTEDVYTEEGDSVVDEHPDQQVAPSVSPADTQLIVARRELADARSSIRSAMVRCYRDKRTRGIGPLFPDAERALNRAEQALVEAMGW